MGAPRLFAHQEHWLEETRDVNGHAVFWDQGTGKTGFALSTAEYLYRTGKIDAVLVFAPNGVQRQWAEDQGVWLHRDCRVGMYLTKSAKTQWHNKEVARCLEAKFPIYIMTYSGVMTEGGRKAAKRFLQKRRVLFILDESTAIQHQNTSVSKRVISLSKYAPYRRVMTGTPGETPFKYFPQIGFVDPTHWEKHGVGEWPVFKDFFGEWVKMTQTITTKSGQKKTVTFDQIKKIGNKPQYRNIPILREWVGEVASRVLKTEVFDLPPKLYSKRYFEPTPEQKRVYQDIRNDDIAFLASGNLVTAEMAITRLMRYQQVLSNFVPALSNINDIPTAEIVDKKRNPRMDTLREAVEEIDHPGIIWAKFRHDIKAIAQMLDNAGRSFVVYDGSVSEEHRGRNKRAFMSGRAQWFVGNPAAGGVGLDLPIARTVIYYNNGFKLIDRQQSEDRAHRATTVHPVDYIDIIAPGTVDEHIQRALIAGMDVHSQITGDTLTEWI